jgi:hypothetical protein
MIFVMVPREIFKWGCDDGFSIEGNRAERI